MELRTKQKGDITELKCILSLKEKGLNVCTPVGEDSPYDLIVEIKEVLYRVQCKTSRAGRSREGTFCFNCCTTRANSVFGYTKSNYENKIDYFMTVYEGIPYLIPIEECLLTEKTLRLIKPKNGQTKGISLAEKYTLDMYL